MSVEARVMQQQIGLLFAAERLITALVWKVN